MGIAHALALPGCLDALADGFGPRPLLTSDHVVFLGVDPDAATSWEREQAVSSPLTAVTADMLCADPSQAAVTALAALPAGPLAVHLDVDVLDFTDAPLSESTDGRNSGPSLDQLAIALTTATRHPGGAGPLRR